MEEKRVKEKVNIVLKARDKSSVVINGGTFAESVTQIHYHIAAEKEDKYGVATVVTKAKEVLCLLQTGQLKQAFDMFHPAFAMAIGGYENWEENFRALKGFGDWETVLESVARGPYPWSPLALRMMSVITIVHTSQGHELEIKLGFDVESGDVAELLVQRLKRDGEKGFTCMHCKGSGAKTLYPELLVPPSPSRPMIGYFPGGYLCDVCVGIAENLQDHLDEAKIFCEFWACPRVSRRFYWVKSLMPPQVRCETCMPFGAISVPLFRQKPSELKERGEKERKKLGTSGEGEKEERK